MNIMQVIRNKFPTECWNFTSKRIHMEAKLISSRTLHSHPIRTMMDASESPAILETDGSHIDTKTTKERSDIQHNTTSAVVLCIPTLRERETWQDGNWKNRAATPILARAANLPENFGVHKSDIGHGEGIAMCMALEIISSLTCGVILTDSRAVRDVTRQLSDRE